MRILIPTHGLSHVVQCVRVGTNLPKVSVSGATSALAHLAGADGTALARAWPPGSWTNLVGRCRQPRQLWFIDRNAID